MSLTTLQRRALHVLFSFAQADRPADVRLTARLLMCSQRDLRECLNALALVGLVDERGVLTQRGVTVAARLRQRGRSTSDALPFLDCAA